MSRTLLVIVKDQSSHLVYLNIIFSNAASSGCDFDNRQINQDVISSSDVIFELQVNNLGQTPFELESKMQVSRQYYSPSNNPVKI